jgi:Ser/Thr protein kinase RdoA (MazF antagonist)
MVAEAVTDLLEDTTFELGAVFARLEAAGYMEKVRDDDNDGETWWDTTIQGNALAMASFGKPISRKTANRLISGMLDRARGLQL